MATVLTVISEALKPYTNIIIAIFIFFIFVTLGFYAYNQYYVPYSETQKLADMANSNGRKKLANIYFFYVDWCPYCKTAKPEWNTFKLQYNNVEKGGYIIKCYDINCTDDNGEINISEMPDDANGLIQTTPTKIADMIRKYKIDAYPTIKMTKDSTTIDYDAKITSEHLDQFIESAL
jgi:thiol-disulfide isomerase/thioredoxin